MSVFLRKNCLVSRRWSSSHDLLLSAMSTDEKTRSNSYNLEYLKNIPQTNFMEFAERNHLGSVAAHFLIDTLGENHKFSPEWMSQHRQFEKRSPQRRSPIAA